MLPPEDKLTKKVRKIMERTPDGMWIVGAVGFFIVCAQYLQTTCEKRVDLLVYL